MCTQWIRIGIYMESYWINECVCVCVLTKKYESLIRDEPTPIWAKFVELILFTLVTYWSGSFASMTTFKKKWLRVPSAWVNEWRARRMGRGRKLVRVEGKLQTNCSNTHLLLDRDEHSVHMTHTIVPIVFPLSIRFFFVESPHYSHRNLWGAPKCKQNQVHWKLN